MVRLANTGTRRVGVKLLSAAAHVCLEALTRNQRGPKKPRNPKPVYHKQHKHYSTARLLKEQSDTC